MKSPSSGRPRIILDPTIRGWDFQSQSVVGTSCPHNANRRAISRFEPTKSKSFPSQSAIRKRTATTKPPAQFLHQLRTQAKFRLRQSSENILNYHSCSSCLL